MSGTGQLNLPLQASGEPSSSGRNTSGRKGTKRKTKAGGSGRSGGGGGRVGGDGDDGGLPPIPDTSLAREAEKRYLTYALSVITSRALPDVRDGL